MKREGWQHGAVRVNRSKLLRIEAAAEKAGEAAVVAAPSKPTNASRITGKCRRPRCRGCHDHPADKARDKAKGAHKLRACDVALNHRLVSWRVVDSAGAWAAGTGIPDYKGASASAVLAYLAGGSSYHEDDDDGGAPALEAAPPASGSGLSDLYDLIVGHHAAARQEPDTARATDIEVANKDGIEEEPDQDAAAASGEEEEEDDMGFFMVGITIALEFSDGEEDWIVVEEI
ncbi:uncharacterized protein [Oryza sativa Japonica Group]|jgi:hypothetical protein|uniref:Uncharacterized protein n=2 Tax=Oryza TaxID=4527 RepID=A0A0E0PK90_ORYRU|nr:uncharacterized protein LOC107280835 [Oryza sativa Japonica Group]XP_052154691.1 uncharacterized protein LOC127772767 [Oryza glaberrima]EAY97407.1 hypothetical protein OsI_19336 [Oryza sativa Indica Group]KAF2930042.1 hypothetical protein DAI22_05g102300 [Oryza sativa Japonica Group]